MWHGALKGEQIASGSNKEVFIWDSTGKKISQLEGHSSWVNSVAWSPSEDQLASGSDDKTAIVWDSKTGRKFSELKGHSGGVNSVAWSDGGDQVASGSSDKTLLVWDAKTGQNISQLAGHTSGVMSVAWSPKGDQPASASDGPVAKEMAEEQRRKEACEEKTRKEAGEEKARKLTASPQSEVKLHSSKPWRIFPNIVLSVITSE